MKKEQPGDGFDNFADEFLTYSFSDHVRASQSTYKKQYKSRKQEQKPLITIIQPSTKDNTQPKIKYSKRDIFTNTGRIIKLGSITFRSNFQSGSLGSVTQLTPTTYKLCLQIQSSSSRPCSWFYFTCQGLQGQINFIIHGFTKSTSLYNQGMKICFREGRQQWRRGTGKVSYGEGEDGGFQLGFTFGFGQGKEVSFAYAFPYQYSRVVKLARSLANAQNVTYQSLGQSYQGRDIPLLTIGNPSATKSIVLSARVHPGQTVASFIIEGFIKQLISDSQFAKNLRSQFHFKIIPMINPDGVVRGNYRFSAAGYDLNRRWKNCYQSSHPQIYYLKSFIKKLNKQKKIALYIDIHGHSRKKNSFFYGCCSLQNQLSFSKPKQFPYLMQKINPHFKYDSCIFTYSKDKQGTARVTMWKQLKIPHVYTLQSSFYGSDNQQYVQEDYLRIGKFLMDGIGVYFYESCNVDKNTISSSNLNANINQQIDSYLSRINLLNEQVKKELSNDIKLLNMGMGKNDSGSDSEPEAGFIPQQQRKPMSKNQKLQIKNKQFIRKDRLMQSRSPIQLSKNPIKVNVRFAPKNRKSKINSQYIKHAAQQELQQIYQPVQKSFSKTISNFPSTPSQHLQSLTTESLSKRNQRVHSKQLDLKTNRINSQNLIFDLNQPKAKIQILSRNLMKTREGAQYRRVRIIAQEMRGRSFEIKREGRFGQLFEPIVRGIMTGHHEQSFSRKQKVKSTMSNFYPHYQSQQSQSQQSQYSSKKLSAQVAVRRTINSQNIFPNQNIYINGDEINVHCKGTKIFL